MLTWIGEPMASCCGSASRPVASRGFRFSCQPGVLPALGGGRVRGCKGTSVVVAGETKRHQQDQGERRLDKQQTKTCCIVQFASMESSSGSRENGVGPSRMHGRWLAAKGCLHNDIHLPPSIFRDGHWRGIEGGAGPKNPPPITTPDNLVNQRAPSQPEAALPSSSSRIGRIAQLASRRILSRPLPAEHPSPNNRPSCPGKVRTTPQSPLGTTPTFVIGERVANT